MEDEPRSGAYRTLTPAASRRTHLLAAALLWTAVGAMLAVTGAPLLFEHAAGTAVPLALLAVAAGVAKARWTILPAARRIADRIEQRGDGRCLGGFLSWRTWIFVLVMAGFGRVVRGLPIPSTVRGTVLVAVGVALLVGAAALWRRRQAGALRPSV
ncbi:MAG: hypothetical protein GF346_06695 [Candidatus Eisenbacteria bacterium]|nr:hypothetical protein [Candidatus Latescibacterota bacterium]MBD3302116.1 hypothetical protein [Candidatus Eisenbacteria bacterium]